jgi:hypothetical protein
VDCSSFESLILSHHSRFNVACEGNKEEIDDDGDATKGPMWGYPRGRFWDLGTVSEPFCGKLLPKIDKLVKS